MLLKSIQLISHYLFLSFAVLQDSATDSEEIIYPIRAPSSCCSAPPDLLLTTGQDQTDCSGHVGVGGGRQAMIATGAATTTNCHNSPVTSCSGGAIMTEHYQVHRRNRQKTRAVKENLMKTTTTPTMQDGPALVVTEELVRLEVSLRTIWTHG